MPTQRQAKSEMVYTELRKRILMSEYPSGYRLVLGRLAEEFDVSIVPVREAIRRLEAEGFVTFIHNVGAEVAPVDVDSYRDSMLVLMYLEGVATALSAPYLTEEDLREAEAINEEMKALVVEGAFEPVHYSSLNGRFHMHLCQKCPNTRLMDLLKSESERAMMIRRSAFRFTMQRSLESVSQHSRLLELIRQGASSWEIEEFARNHKLTSLQALKLV